MLLDLGFEDLFYEVRKRPVFRFGKRNKFRFRRAVDLEGDSNANLRPFKAFCSRLPLSRSNLLCCDYMS